MWGGGCCTVASGLLALESRKQCLLCNFYHPADREQGHRQLGPFGSLAPQLYSFPSFQDLYKFCHLSISI